MSLLSLHDNILQRAFKPVTVNLIVQRLSTFNVKAAATTAAGSSSIVFNNLPSGMTGVLAGDQFGYALTHVISTDELAAGGQITASFSPVLPGQIASGTALKITRAAEFSCRGWSKKLDTARAVAPGVTAGDYLASVFVNSLSITPVKCDLIVIDGVARTIKNTAFDESRTMWSLLCS